MTNDLLFEGLTLAIPGLVWVSDSHGYVEFNNAHWTDFTGMPQEYGLGHGWLDAIHPTDAAAFRAQIPFASAATETVQAEMRVRRHDGVYHRHLLNVRQIAEGKWVGCAIDAHEWLTTALRDATLGTILDMAIAGTDLHVLLGQLCKAAEGQIPGAACSILLVDAGEKCFSAGVAPNLPTEMVNAVCGVKIGAGVGSCGTAAFEKRDVISPNMATDPHWKIWRGLVLPLGFRSCWSKPVFDSRGEVIATFGFYFKDERIPSDAELRELSRLRGLASLAIERAHMFEALRESEEHYRHTVEQNPQIPWTSDPKGQILSVSSRLAEMTGISQLEALGEGWLQALHMDDVALTKEAWREALATGRPLDVYYRVRLKTGDCRWMRARATARLDQAGRIFRWYGTVEDVHEQYLASEKLKRQAFMDDLTELPNRRRFVAELTRRLDEGTSPIGLLVLDMDDFKLVNDRYGHLTGDAVLRLSGRYLQRVAQPNEFVARLGGDEFAVICGDSADNDTVMERARSIEAELDGHLKANRKTRTCKASIGCAIGRRGDDADEIFKKADLALYAAKSAGKGIVKLFDPTIRSAASQRCDALDLARAALREDWIEPFYQPVVSLFDHSVRGFEALLRIRHPVRGLLTPNTIKDALDNPQQADAIALRIADKVVHDISSIERGGGGMGQISINLATENLVRADFISTLLRLLDTRGVPRTAVKLEITERVLMDELGKAVVDNLTRLQGSGIEISLDDFGTGYASLIHLQMLPVDEIKIDRSFVSGLGTEGKRGEIVKAMLGLARSLGIVTVAEGIEAECELRTLAGWGCDFGQGFLFAPPMPFQEAVSWNAQHQREHFKPKIDLRSPLR